MESKPNHMLVDPKIDLGIDPDLENEAANDIDAHDPDRDPEIDTSTPLPDTDPDTEYPPSSPHRVF